jgi:hypothetical protein
VAEKYGTEINDDTHEETTVLGEPVTDTPTATTSRRPDPVALLVGLLTLGMAVAAFVGQVPDLSWLDARWLLAGAAAAVGALLLVTSLRNRRNSP